MCVFSLVLSICLLEGLCDDVVVRLDRDGDLELRVVLHGALDAELRVVVATPRASCNAVVDVPAEHELRAALGVLCAVEHHAKAAVDDLAPADATAVVQRNPRRATEAVAAEVLDSHVGSERRAVVDVGGLAVRRVRAADVVVVARDVHRRLQSAVSHGVVEREGDRGAPERVRVQDACLRADDELVLLGLDDPLVVVVVLLRESLGGALGELRDDLRGDLVGEGEVGRVAGRAHPPEGAEAEREDVAHDVLDVGRVLERAVLLEDVRASARALQQEGVAVVPEAHALRTEFVDDGDVAAQALVDLVLELLRVVRHHGVGLLEGESGGVVPAVEGVVEGGLVGPELGDEVVCEEALEEVHDVALVGDGDGLLLLLRLPRDADDFLDVVDDDVDPSLLVALLRRRRVHFGDDADDSADARSLALCAAHAAETTRYEQLPVKILAEKKNYLLLKRQMGKKMGKMGKNWLNKARGVSDGIWGEWEMNKVQNKKERTKRNK